MSLALIRPPAAVDLNPEQQLAVEHGIGAADGPSAAARHRGRGLRQDGDARPSGGGADPRRRRSEAHHAGDLLAPRRGRAHPPGRAAARPPPRARSRGGGGARPTPAHSTPSARGCCANMRRALGLDPQFTIHDREDSADLMNWARHEAGLTETQERFPDQGDLPRHLFARRQRPRRARRDARQWFPWVGGARGGAARPVRRLCRGEAAPERARLRRPPALLRPDAGRAGDRGRDRRPLRPSAGRRIPGHQRAAGRDRAGAAPERARALLSSATTRSRSIPSAPRRCATSSTFPKAFDPPARVVTLDRNYRSTQAILSAANAVIALAPERFAKDLWTDRDAGRAPALVTVAEEADQARYVATRVLANREAGAALKSQAVLFRASHHSAALELELTRRNIPFVKFGGLKFLDAAHVKDALALDALRREPARPGRGLSRRPASAGRRAEDRRDDRRRGGGRRRLRGDVGARACRPAPAPASPPSPTCMRRLASRAAPWPGELADAVAWLVAADRDALRRRGGADRPISRRSNGSPRSFASRERFLERTDPRSARRDQRRSGAAASRRGLSHPLDHPFGQGAGMALGVRAELRRRLHPLRSRDRLVRRRSRRSGACSMSR